MYSGIIKGAAMMPKTAKETRMDITRINSPSFPLNLKFDIFSESNGILLTINNDNITVKIMSNTGEPIKELKIGEWE